MEPSYYNRYDEKCKLGRECVGCLAAPMVVYWKRNILYIIRSEDSLHHIRRYIQGNPAQWAEDRYYCHS